MLELFLTNLDLLLTSGHSLGGLICAYSLFCFGLGSALAFAYYADVFPDASPEVEESPTIEESLSYFRDGYMCHQINGGVTLSAIWAALERAGLEEQSWQGRAFKDGYMASGSDDPDDQDMLFEAYGIRDHMSLIYY